MADVKHCTVSPINDFEGFLHIFYCRIKNFTESLTEKLLYFVKLVDRGECKIIGSRLTMFGLRIVEFLHKRTCRIFSLLALASWRAVVSFTDIYIKRMWPSSLGCWT
jgi:hypothetical protein